MSTFASPSQKSFVSGAASAIETINIFIHGAFNSSISGQTHIFNSPEDAEKALTIRVLQNLVLTQQYSLEIQKQLRGFFADQINIANGSIPNHLLPDANNGSINISSSGKIGYNEAAIESLKQSIMNLVMTSAKYCDKLIEMNPVPCSSS